MRRKPRPPTPDPRPAWMIEQGNRCGCRGTDDMCPCQSVNPWPQPSIDWRARAEAAEARVATLMAELERLETQAGTAELRALNQQRRADTLEGQVEEARKALEKLAAYAPRGKLGGDRGSYQRGYDNGFESAGSYAANVARSALAKLEGETP